MFFIDSSYRKVEGIGAAFECALTMLTTIVSRPNPTRLIVDAGAKVLTSESGAPQPVGIDGLEMRGLSEEHGEYDGRPKCCTQARRQD